MKTDKNTPKTAEIDEILHLYSQFRAKSLAKSQGEFAKLVGIDQSTLSATVHNQAGYSATNLLEKVRRAARQHGIEVSASNNSQALQVGDNYGEQKILSSDNARWFDLCAEKDKQIDRLLGIIEKMQS